MSIQNAPAMSAQIPTSIYDLLSAAVDNDNHGVANKLTLPVGWETFGAGQHENSDSVFGDGFSAQAYQQQGTKNIVISFEGTDLTSLGQTVKDGSSDIALGMGLGSA